MPSNGSIRDVAKGLFSNAGNGDREWCRHSKTGKPPKTASLHGQEVFTFQAHPGKSDLSGRYDHEISRLGDRLHPGYAEIRVAKFPQESYRLDTLAV